MNPEFDYDLTPDQWEMLKALRTPAAERPRLESIRRRKSHRTPLAEMTDGRPA